MTSEQLFLYYNRVGNNQPTPPPQKQPFGIVRREADMGVAWTLWVEMFLVECREVYNARSCHSGTAPSVPLSFQRYFSNLALHYWLGYIVVSMTFCVCSLFSLPPYSIPLSSIACLFLRKSHSTRLLCIGVQNALSFIVLQTIWIMQS